MNCPSTSFSISLEPLIIKSLSSHNFVPMERNIIGKSVGRMASEMQLLIRIHKIIFAHNE